MSHDDRHDASRGPDVQQPEPGDSTDEETLEVNPELHPTATDDLPDEGAGDAGRSGTERQKTPDHKGS